jgi:AraC-like DNA-binding protein
MKDHRVSELSGFCRTTAAPEAGVNPLPDAPVHEVRRLTGDCDQLAAAYTNVDVAVIQTGPAAGPGLMVVAPLSQGNLHYVFIPAPVLVHGTTVERGVSFMVPLAPQPGHVVNGEMFHPNMFVIAGSRADHFAQEPGGKNSFFAALPEELVRQALAAATGQDSPYIPTHVQVLEAQPAGFAALRQTLQQIHDQAVKNPDLFSSPLARRNMERALVTSWVHAWVSARPVWKANGSGAKWYSDDNLKRALEHLGEHHNQPVYLLELCRTLGVSARTLELLFKRNLGVSPMRYLKLRRLQQAQTRLRAADPHQSYVKSVALEAGFWDLGRFAVEYRRLFKESPSATLRKNGGFDSGTPGR